MSVLAELSDSIGAAAERVGPSVVGLGRGWGRGSGVVVGDGLVLTNAHNLRDDEVDADVAVISVDTADAPAIEWAPDPAPGIGAAVFALANPGGRGLRATL